MDSSSVGSEAVSRLEVLEGPSGRRVRSEAEWARIVGESLLPGAQVRRQRASSERRAGKFTIGNDASDSAANYRRARLRSRRSQPLVVDGLLEERHVPAVKLEIAIGDVVVRTDAAKADEAIDGEQLSRLIRAVRASRYCPRLRTEDLYRDATRRLPLCGHDGLGAKVQEILGFDPFSGAAFVFRSKRTDRIEILVWDRTGLVLVQKRLEACKFVWPKLADGVVRISPAMFTALFEGLAWRLVRPEEARRPQIAGSVRQNDSVPSWAWHRRRRKR
ncbi:IS66 family insertion sequence element accessory protein TnpB [Bradyrhizobium yuanmingense]|uniref:IS66 family insertion sequence element accessory protein TnpB n=1 Tax=Bradyrhizobium yuanmingense TaxID=108015 RepID=UPI0023B95045|nr:IS66 family insertion sequence element accessory protein TnpB [Bradyrhizobium yuanmingense]MDF0516690.1 IS66 family insertion sequence element accessory protein TnpB [Bradyrhizobium yuanmingense]